ncbi:hypothetical protein B0T13DRAFT_194625 [Neurospora crassa]|nr:hypothetical protein B0T13DRAFT_194625 [Neurospora crassa]
MVCHLVDMSEEGEKKIDITNNCFKATIWDILSGWFLPQLMLDCYTQRVPNSGSGLRGKPLLRRTGNQTWPYGDEMAYFFSLYLRNVFSLTLVRMSIEGHTYRLVLVVQRGSWSSRMTFQQLSWVDVVELGNTDPHKRQPGRLHSVCSMSEWYLGACFSTSPSDEVLVSDPCRRSFSY